MTETLYVNKGKVNELFSDFGVTLKKNVLPVLMAGSIMVSSPNIVTRDKDSIKSFADSSMDIVDDLVHTGKAEASSIIGSNTNSIIKYAVKYNVNPLILASCIYTEQVNNVNVFDKFDSELAKYCFLDTSIGVSQVKVSTAELLENKNYVDRYCLNPNRNMGCLSEKYSDNKRIVDNLCDSDKNIEYAAAYLSYLCDVWEPFHPGIRNDSSILGTLYNLGHEKRGKGFMGYMFGVGNQPRVPHVNPEANEFGCDVSENVSIVSNIMLSTNSNYRDDSEEKDSKVKHITMSVNDDTKSLAA